MLLLLFLFWLALNAKCSLQILLVGAALTGAVYFFLCRYGEWSWRREVVSWRLISRFLLYAAALLWEIVKANCTVLGIVIRGNPSPVVRQITTPLQTRIGRAMLSSAITITPGTVTLLQEDSRLTVHCLNDSLAAGLDAMPLEKRLLRMEAIWLGKRL